MTSREKRGLFVIDDAERRDPTRHVDLTIDLGHTTLDKILDSVEETAGYNSYFLWGDRIYFENPQAAVMVKLKWGEYVI